jgi:hypothetical protein
MPDQPPLDRLPASPQAPEMQPEMQEVPGAAAAGPARWGRGARRLPWLALGKVALVTAAALASLGATWLRWINPFVDSGREMNVPARLAAGERLYRDIVYYYGPAGPWLQALVLRVADWTGRLAPAGPPRLRLPPVAALLADRSWLPLEIACLALAAAILFLLHQLAAAAGGPRSALAATALAAAFCLGAPHGGAFVFPYSAASLYALAGALLALTASLRPPGWRRRIPVAAGLALALTARAEIGAATAAILLLSVLRSRRTLAPRPHPDGAAAGSAAPVAAKRAMPLAMHLAVSDLALGVASALAIYGAAFAGVSWHVLLAQGPLTHALAMPPEWKQLYGTVSGLARLDRSLPELAWGMALDALLLAICAWPLGAKSRPFAASRESAAAPPAGTPPAPAAQEPLAAKSATAAQSARLRPASRPPLLPRLAFCAAAAAGIAAFSWWGGMLRWPCGRIADDLPPLLLPLPLVAGAAALAALRRPLDERGRARFMLFALAAALGSRVVLGCKLGPQMSAYCALPLPALLATAGVLAADLLAPRLRNPGAFRFRLAALAAGLAGLYLFRLGALAWGPHIVRLDTPAGSLRLPWKEANAIDGTLDYLAGRARPGDRLASFPEAGFFNFVTGLPNPLREEEIFPGVLGGGREAEAIARLLATRPRFVLLANRPTPEFGPRAFGDDYAASLWSVVEDHYSLAATFGNAAEGAPIGARRFFIRIYERIYEPHPAAREAARWISRAPRAAARPAPAGRSAAGPGSPTAG